mgnify:CR=1 FL=1
MIATFIVAGGIVPGFPFLASAIAIFSGVQLFALGIIGEYVARIHLRTMDRPSYLARETTAEPETTPETAAAAHPGDAGARAFTGILTAMSSSRVSLAGLAKPKTIEVNHG